MNKNETEIRPLYIAFRSARNEAAKRFIERSERFGYKGRSRDAYAFEFMIGSMSAIVADYADMENLLMHWVYNLSYAYSAYGQVKRWAEGVE